MRILFVNNHGGGFADFINVEDGLTVQQLFDQQINSGKPEDFMIRVNRQPVPATQVLSDNDRISITPTKIEGARC